eukprot:Gb_16203 [translate_table: standard]
MLCCFENNSFWFQDKVVQSNGFIINHITNEGAKWVVRILTKRLVGIEASTYLSHQWAAVVATLSKDTAYPWASWVVDKFKEHCVSSQMSGCNFPMPSLLVVICIEALGPSGWIQPDELPRLNSYSLLPKKGVIRENTTDAYLALRRLNNGPEASKKLPEYIKPRRQLVVDYLLVSPMDQHHYWTINKAHFPKEPYSVAWSPPDLPRITLLDVQEKEDDHEKRRIGARISPASPLGLEGELAKLDREYTDEGDWEKALATREAPSIPPKAEARLSRDEVGELRQHLTHNIDKISEGEEVRHSQLSKLASLCNQLASKRAALEGGYDELLVIIDLEQRMSREAIVLQQREEVDSLQSKILMEKQTCLGEYNIESSNPTVALVGERLEPQGDTPLDERNQVPESIEEVGTQGANQEIETPLPSTAIESILGPPTEQPERGSPSLPSKEFET